jgi:hypothetical protein
VIRDPVYSDQADAALATLADGVDLRLYDAVCDAIDLICDHGDSAEARREQLRTVAGSTVWKVAVRTRHQGWVVLWWPVEDKALIAYIGHL